MPDRKLVCLALMVVISTFACQPEEHPFGTTRCPIFGGVQDTTPEHMAVVYMQMVEGNMAAACSGTLIGPRIVLTAGHCVSGFAPDEVTVFFGNSTTGAQMRGVSEVRAHPSYRGLRNDIALVRLEEDPPSGIVPIPFLPHSMEISNYDVGRPLEFVGFGVTETGSSGVKMTVTNNLSWICVSGNCPVSGGVTNTICQDQKPGGPCSGDSGGPAFVKRSGIEYVCGITSFGDEYCLEYGCSTKVDEFEDFIRSFAGDPVGVPCVEDVDCLSNSCVDGMCCENECAGRCEGCNQPGYPGLCVQLPNGSPCPDSDVCNGNEVCSDGSCQRGEPLVCRDSIDCTVDTCDPLGGCTFRPLAADCNDNEVCTRDLCDLEQGCVHEPFQDGLECAKNMICQAGVCKKKPSPGGCSSGGSARSPVFMLLVFLPLLRRFTNRAANRAA